MMASLTAYIDLLDGWQPPAHPTATDAAEAMLRLSRQAKATQNDLQPGLRIGRTTVYQLKSRLVRALYEAGYAVSVETETKRSVSQDEAWLLYVFVFRIDGVLYRWHTPLEDVTWRVDLKPPPPRQTGRFPRVGCRPGIHPEEQIRRDVATVRAYLKQVGG